MKTTHKEECEHYKKAREFWINDSKQVSDDDATSLFIIATRLALGEDEDPRDIKFAMELYHKAAEISTPIAGGHPAAMLHLAIHYERGIGAKQDYEKALYWYNRVLEHPNDVVGGRRRANGFSLVGTPPLLP